MSSIQTGIVLQDNFTSVMYGIINSVNMAVSQMYEMEQTMNANIDTSGFEAIQNEIASVTIALDEMNAAYENMDDSISQNTRQQGQFNLEIQNGVNNTNDLQNMLKKAGTALFGVARNAVKFIEDCTDAYDTQRNAENQLMTVLANTLDAGYVAQFEVETDTAGAVSEINGIQDNMDNISVTVSANTQALQAEFDAITAKAAEIQSNGIYSDEVMIAAATEFSTYFTDTSAMEMMMDTLADYAMGMTGGGAIDTTAMVDYATNLGKIMSGSYDAMTKKGFEFTDAQKAIIEGTATQQQIVAVLGAEYLDMSEDMQAAAAITQVIDETWAGLYETMSDTPQGKIIQMANAWGNMQEVVGGQLYPCVILLVDAITSHWGTIEKIVRGITNALKVTMTVLSWLLEGVLNFVDYVIDNWSVIEPFIIGIAGALAIYYGWQLLCAIGNTLISATMNLLSNKPVLVVMSAIIALIAVIYKSCQEIAEMAEVANTGFGVITGGVNVAIQFFKNWGLTMANVALGVWNALCACAYNFEIAFHNAIFNVRGWFYELLSTVLTVVENVCKALNKIPFVNIDYSGIASAANDYAAKSAAEYGNIEEYTNVSDAFYEGSLAFDTFQDGWASDAFAAGASWGDGVIDSISGMFSFNDAQNDVLNSLAQYEGIASDVNSVAEDTGNIADAISVTEEELKYLRDLAEQEAVNRFTIAEISIDQSGMQNTIKNGDDLDGFVSGLTDAVNEAVNIITEGVHE